MSTSLTASLRAALPLLLIALLAMVALLTLERVSTIADVPSIGIISPEFVSHGGPQPHPNPPCGHGNQPACPVSP